VQKPSVARKRASTPRIRAREYKANTRANTPRVHARTVSCKKSAGKSEKETRPSAQLPCKIHELGKNTERSPNRKTPQFMFSHAHFIETKDSNKTHTCENMNSYVSVLGDSFG